MKTDRLVSIIMVLLQRRKISAARLAEMFEVSVRTIYRDLEAIERAGVPIVTYPGAGGGVGIMEQYKVDKSLFTTDEVAALLAGLGSIHATLPQGRLTSAMAKVRGMVPPEHLQELECRAGQVEIDLTPWQGNSRIGPLLDLLRQAVEQHRLVAFSYLDRQGNATQRQVEPHRLVLKGMEWYLRGWCQSRRDFRVFKLGRMRGAEMREQTFLPRPLPPEPMGSGDWGEREIPVTLRVTKEGLEFWQELFDVEWEPAADGRSQFTFAFVEAEWCYRWLLQMGPHCEVMAPEHIRLEVARRLREAAAQYESGGRA